MQNKVIFTLLFLFLSSILFSNDILTQYRVNGIYKIQKQMDKDLASKEYWKSYLKDVDTTFGFIESYPNVLACDKSKSTLTLYRKDVNNTYKITREYAAFTGKVKGDKTVEGDLKTPVGIYNIVKKISKVDSFYGPMAFVTSYPNTYDTYRNKNGHGIWIHGLPIEEERDEFTKGCIAINNVDIECLNKNIDIEKTLLIINEEVVEKNISKEILSDILSNLYEWRYAWLYNDVDAYLNFYDVNFRRVDGMELERFKKYKRRIFAKNEKKTILFNNINIVPYPNTENLYKITFLEKYQSSSFSFTGEKVLIVRITKKHIKIITEK